MRRAVSSDSKQVDPSLESEKNIHHICPEIQLF